MRIGIIGAMDVEMERLKSRMQAVSTTTVSRIVYHCGTLCGKDIVLAVSGVGKVNAALCAQTMILKFGADCMINTGVAGGIDESVRVFDIVIASSVVQHDFDLTPLGFEPGRIMGMDSASFNCAPRLIEGLSKAAASLREARVLTGVIATGDQFLNDANHARQIARTFGALACEMEGGSIGQVCKLNDIDFCVVRTISDGGDDAAHMDFPQFCDIAANKSVEMIKAFLQSI